MPVRGSEALTPTLSRAAGAPSPGLSAWGAEWRDLLAELACVSPASLGGSRRPRPESCWDVSKARGCPGILAFLGGPCGGLGLSA